MSLIESLKAEYQDLLKKAQAIQDGATARGEEMNDNEVDQVNALMDQAEAKDGEIQKAEKRKAAQARLKSTSANLSEPSPRQTDPDEPVVEHVHDRLLDDPSFGFNNIGEFATSVRGANRQVNPSGEIDERLLITSAATGMSQAVGADGGFTVPPEFSSRIWDGLNEMPDNLLNMTEQFTVEGESITFNANAETSRATGSRYGGIQGYWLAEAQQITASKPKFRQVKLEPQELGVLVYVTDKLLRNSNTALSQYLTRAASDEINFLTGDAIIDGSGVGKPKGILKSGALVSVAKESGQAAATVVAENIDKMWSRLHPKARPGAVWLVNVDIEPQLQSMGFDVGNGGVPLFRPADGLAGRPLDTLKNRPIMPIEYCKTLGTKGDIILADMKGYTTGVRGSVRSAMSIHLRFDFAETAFRFMFEADGQTWLNSAITPFNGTNTLSHFVSLDTRA